jgi:hypothetical protein
MSRSYFNSEQNAHMDALDLIPIAARCWCAWYLKGQCPTCPPHLSAADKMATKCQECGSYQISHNSPGVYHRKGCGKEPKP